MKVKVIFLISLVTILIGGLVVNGCGTPEPTPTPTATTTTSIPIINVAGNWSGPIESSLAGVEKASIVCQQTGISVTGIYCAKNTRGEFSGTISGNMVSFTITITYPPTCSGSYNGTGKLDEPQNNTMTFEYSGSSTCGGEENGFGVLKRQ